MKKKQLVTYIIVTWNGRENLKECLSSLRKVRTSYPYETVIVDNGSDDGSAELLNEFKKNIRELRVIRNRTNKGYAEGNTIGYKAAKGDYIVFLNDDTLVDPRFLDPLINELNNDLSLGAVQPLILNYPEKTIIDSIGSYFITTGFLYHFGHNKHIMKKYEKPSFIFSMKGACMVIRREVLEKTGLFDKKYFAYFEESDLCHRIWLSGYRIKYVPVSKIFHKGGQTAKRLNSTFIQYHSYKNRIYTYLKNFEWFTNLKVLPLHILMCELTALAYLLTLKIGYFLAIQRAILWNIGQLKDLRTARKHVSRIRKLTDNQYLPGLTRSVRPNYYYHLFSTALAGYKE